MWWYNQPIRCFIPHWVSFIPHLPLTHYVCRRIPVLSANQTPAAIFIRPTDSAASCEKSWAPEIEWERLRNAQSERGCKNLHFDMNKTVQINLTWDQWTEPVWARDGSGSGTDSGFNIYFHVCLSSLSTSDINKLKVEETVVILNEPLKVQSESLESQTGTHQVQLTQTGTDLVQLTQTGTDQVQLTQTGTDQCCAPIFILPWVHLNVVHYPHLISTQISAGECCSKSNTPCWTYWKLWSWQPLRLVTCQKHPTLNGEQKTSTALLFNSYNPTVLQCCRRCCLCSYLNKESELSAAGWLRFFRYVDKMAAVECVKCTSLHTQSFCRYEGNIRVL